MPRSRILRRRLVVLLVVLLLGGCAALKYRSAEPPRVTLSGLRVVDVSLFEQRFELALRLQNPNDFALPITGMDYRLQLAGHDFAHGVSSERVTIPANGEVVVRVPVVTSLLENVALIRRISRQPPETLGYGLAGRISLAGVPVALPFEYDGEIDFVAGDR